MAYAINWSLGTALSIRNGIEARPFGLCTGWGVSRDAVLGVGTGLSAPWPMIAFLMVRARMAPSVLWFLFLVGALSEPITYAAATGRATRTESVVAGLNVAVPLAMFLNGRTEPDAVSR